MKVFKKCEGGRFLPALILLLLLAAGLLLLPFCTCLSLSTEEQGTVCALPLKDGEQFSIRFMHSVNRSPVVDTMERTGKTITIRSSLYRSFGAGMPASADEVGEEATFTETPEGIYIDGIDLEKDEIHKFTGTYADHYLLYRGRELRLKELVGEQTDLCFKLRRFSFLQILYYGRLM
ncbi:MAG: DUF1850 domain-containing protein [Hydrogenoanaerobacterium sp.]